MQNLAQPLMSGPQRDLTAARNAYKAGDVEASHAAHSAQGGVKATEDHIEAGGRVKSIVFGGCVHCGSWSFSAAHRRIGFGVCAPGRLDGILTSFAVLL